MCIPPKFLAQPPCKNETPASNQACTGALRSPLSPVLLPLGSVCHAARHILGVGDALKHCTVHPLLWLLWLQSRDTAGLHPAALCPQQTLPAFPAIIGGPDHCWHAIYILPTEQEISPGTNRALLHLPAVLLPAGPII